MACIVVLVSITLCTKAVMVVVVIVGNVMLQVIMKDVRFTSVALSRKILKLVMNAKNFRVQS